MSAATKGAVVQRVVPARNGGTRYFLSGGITVYLNAEHGRYVCLTCCGNDCEHTRAARDCDVQELADA